ncbi:MAG TPA: GNAT family N-acetyltransferase [Nitrososphaerales archaeon]|nr:GNAT family N-acetyltransferase [Nitrososphaerales archaeon]
MTEFKVRQAGERDIPTLTSQRHRMFEDMHSPPSEDHAVHDNAFPGWAKKEIKANRFFCFLVQTDDGRTVGGATLWLREVQPYPGFAGGKVPYLMSVYTEPEFRGRGVATLVIKRAMDWANERGFHSMSLHASKDGRKIYESLGWKSGNEMDYEFSSKQETRRPPRRRAR